MIEVIRHKGKLKREYWVFDFIVPPHVNRPQIALNYYAQQYKDSPEQKTWLTDKHWGVQNMRLYTLDSVTVPPDVLDEAKGEIIKAINEIKEISIRNW